MSKDKGLPALSDEFAEAELGDGRRVRRLQLILDSAVRNPRASLPEQAGSDAALEGTYRFLGNPDISPEAVLEPHLNQTAKRGVEAGLVSVVHDTTIFEFPGEAQRDGLGPLRGKGQGFLAHFSLAFQSDGKPLGVAALRAWKRSPKSKPKTNRHGDESRESLRWYDAVEEVSERLSGCSKIIHIMDREADSYELFSQMVDLSHRFVVRLAHNRALEKSWRPQPEPSKLFESMRDGRVTLTREITIKARAKRINSISANRINPPRGSRVTTVEIRACSIRFYAQSIPAKALARIFDSKFC